MIKNVSRDRERRGRRWGKPRTDIRERRGGDGGRKRIKLDQ